jgi:hypothetical protein
MRKSGFSMIGTLATLNYLQVLGCKAVFWYDSAGFTPTHPLIPDFLKIVLFLMFRRAGCERFVTWIWMEGFHPANKTQT